MSRLVYRVQDLIGFDYTADEANMYHYDWNKSGQSWDLVTTVI